MNLDRKRKYASGEEDTSESDFDNSDNEVEYENESDPWVPSKAEASNELTQSFAGDDLEEEEGKKQRIFSNSTKASKRLTKTWDVFVNDDNFDEEEALETAIDKRKCLTKIVTMTLLKKFMKTVYNLDAMIVE